MEFETLISRLRMFIHFLEIEMCDDMKIVNRYMFRFRFFIKTMFLVLFLQ